MSVPNLEEIPLPQLESELKKAQTQVKPTNKSVSVSVVEGTSVMPRQRPKGSSANPLNLNNLPLTLSPSPTTVKKSQSPVTFTDNQIPRQNYPNTAYSTTFPANSQNFTSTSPFQNSQSFFPNPESTEKHFENLFQSSIYPDPFRDESGKIDGEPDIPVTQSNMPVNVVSPVTPDQPLMGSGHLLSGMSSKVGLLESTSQSMVGSNETPPTSPSLAAPKGHRRNMSDTTAFNK